MITSSYHNHLAYCDGSGAAVEYAEAALAAGLTSLGLSCHAPVPFESEWNMPLSSLKNYVAEVSAAREAYRGRLPILLGLEVDYLSPDLSPDAAEFQRSEIISQPLDYVVASVHFVGRRTDGYPWTIDETDASFARQLDEVYRGDVRRLVEEYYQHVVAMAEAVPRWERPTIVGHLDKIKMWNVGGRYFAEDADWYVAAVDAALRAIAAAGLVVELNTAGLGRAHGEPYPGPRVLRRCRDLGIPITISSDAHQPVDVARRFDDARRLLRESGISELMTLVDGRWEPRALLD